MTAAAWPGNALVVARLSVACVKEGGAAHAAAVATCARVLMRVVGLVGGMALRSCDACRLHWRSRLDNFAINVVGSRLDLVMVATAVPITSA
jgi:hypothetical protein